MCENTIMVCNCNLLTLLPAEHHDKSEIFFEFSTQYEPFFASKFKGVVLAVFGLETKKKSRAFYRKRNMYLFTKS